jgi:pilus assembly protein Flp/PilA
LRTELEKLSESPDKEIMTHSLLLLVAKLVEEQDGQDLVEYSLLLAFIALAAVALLSAAGTSVTTIWTAINSGLTSAAS